MYAFIVRTMLRRVIAAGREGDIAPMLKNYADDVEFRFPGDNSWSGTYRSKAEVAEWLERFARIGLQVHPEQIIVKGPPWNTHVHIHFTDHLDDAQGNRVYENRGVIYGRVAWGKVRYYEVFEDTEKIRSLDDWLAVNEPR